MFDYSERLMRNAISRCRTANTPQPPISTASWTARSGAKDLPIEVTLTITGDEMFVDLTGTAPQVSDRPINMPFKGTVDCAVWLSVRSVLLDSDLHGEIQQNEGLTRPIKIFAPEGTLANPIFPAPVIARFCPASSCQTLSCRR
jgi:N-methylhydantoinase B